MDWSEVNRYCRVNIDEGIRVGIGEWAVAKSPTPLITLGLGSCVGVGLYDPVAKIGGLAHIMLPDSRSFANGQEIPGKFADLAIPLVYREMVLQGAVGRRIQAVLAGGAQMFSFGGRGPIVNIGQRNLEMIRQVLGGLKVRIRSEDTGGNYGRTMILSTVDGAVFIRVAGGKIKVI